MVQDARYKPGHLVRRVATKHNEAEVQNVT